MRRLWRVRSRCRHTLESGFTLVELMIVVSIIGILATVAVPSYRQSVVKAREAVLRQDLFTMRDLLDQYRADKGKYPATLKDRLAPLTEGEGDSGPRLKSIADALRALHDDLEGSDAAPTEPQRRVQSACDERLERALSLWNEARGSALAALNTALLGAGLKPISIPPVEQIRRHEEGSGKELP